MNNDTEKCSEYGSDLRAEIAELKAQRAELLAACRAAKEYIGVFHNANNRRAPTYAVYEQLRIAIAKAGGGNHD